ncbi:hypothetical protein KP509_36G005900 [Ceratopteris richardii]|uniref:Uncharacterized protein n=1 Tax=Ceratopteris richardii TaxID=49495 RepID=A0A8T2Q949_CERRI|nr:hypothetical protein KP509_36G005900 [Ceratopteris richardii]
MTLLLHKSGVGGVRAELDRSGLQAVLQTKQRVLQSQLSFFQSQEQLQSRLTSLPPSPSPHLLLTAIRNSPRKIAVIVEVARLTPAESPEDLAARCRKYGRLGIDAISVCTDEETSPDGLADLKAVCSVLADCQLERLRSNVPVGYTFVWNQFVHKAFSSSSRPQTRCCQVLAPANAR